MNELSIAMANFWGGFVNVLHNPPRKIPAFLAGYASRADGAGRPVPPDFPYITYEVPRPSFGELAYGTASVWDRNTGSPGWFNLVNNVLEQAEKAVPHEGIVLRLKSGTVWIVRGSGFLSYMDNPADTQVTRGIVSFGIRSFLI